MREKPAPNFTFEEVIKELETLVAKSDEGLFTTKELAASINLSQGTAQRYLARWCEAGLVEYAGYVYREGMDQKSRPIPAYRWLGDKEKEETNE